MNNPATLAKHPLLWCVFLLTGFIAGMWFQDRYGSPKTLQAVTIQKQKVKGDGNAYTTEFEMNQRGAGHEQEERERENSIIRRVFRRRRNGSDSVADRTGETE